MCMYARTRVHICIHVYICVRVYIYGMVYLYRTTSANRSLPDIPKDKSREHEDMVNSVPQDIYETTGNMGDHSELYATVQDAGNIKLIKKNIFKKIKIYKDKN